MKLNIGCGKKHLPGYVSIDTEPTPGAIPPDILADARSIPLGDGVAEEIIAIHVFEHFYIWETEDLLREWHRLLSAGGKLILEMPDIMKAAKNLLDGLTDQMNMWAFYGDPRYKNPLMCHKWGWTAKTLIPFLESHGFANAKSERPIFHKVGIENRDLRVVATKA